MNFIGVTGEIVEVRRSDAELCIEWKIPRFLSLPGGRFDYYESPHFSFWEGSWFLRVFPNWNSSGSVHLYLFRDDEVDSTKTVHVTIGVKGSGGVEMRREGDWEFSHNSCWALNKFCKRSELTELILMPEDVLVILCELRIPGTARGSASSYQDTSVQRDNEFTQPNPRTCTCQSLDKQVLEELQSSLHTLLESEEDCDVTIKVRGKEFRAHRSILRARSPVFRAMFSHDMVEKQKGLVTMEDCDPETFPQFLEHIYTGSIGMISAENVISLFVNSDKYDFQMLKKECTQFMKENMNVASFCDVITVAVKHNEKELIECAMEFFCNNSLDIVKTVEWEVFLAENMKVGNELLIKLLSKR